jgi:hypothetical protein
VDEEGGSTFGGRAFSVDCKVTTSKGMDTTQESLILSLPFLGGQGSSSYSGRLLK